MTLNSSSGEFKVIKLTSELDYYIWLNVSTAYIAYTPSQAFIHLNISEIPEPTVTPLSMPF